MLYDINNLSIYKNCMKKGIKTIIISFLSVIVILVFLAIFTNDKTANIMKYTSMVLLVAVGWFDLYLLFDVVYTNLSKIKILSSIDRARKKEYDCIITSIGKTITVGRYEEATIINIKSEKTDLSCYFSKEFGDVPFVEGKQYNITIANNRIVDYKELD